MSRREELSLSYAIQNNASQHNLRMAIRNAYLAESVETLKSEAVNRGAQGKWFEAACLLELATEE